MAVQSLGGGSASFGTTSCTPTVPAVVNAGDLLVLVVVNKYPGQTPSTPSGWVAERSRFGGSNTGTGVDAGEVRVSVFTREADGTEDGSSVTVTVTSANACGARIFRFRSTGGGKLVFGSNDGEQSTPTVNWSIALSPNLPIKVGDVIMVFQGVNTDAKTWSAQDITATSLTFSLIAERSDTGTTQGDDFGLNIVDFDVTSGIVGSAAMTFVNTANGTANAVAPAGCVVAIVVRELFTGSGGGTCAACEGAGTGEEVFAGTGSGTSSSCTGTGTGELVFAGTGNGTCAACTGSGSGEEVFEGSGAGTCTAATGAGTGALVFEGSGGGACAPCTGAGTGAEVFAGTGNGTCAACTGTGAGELIFSGSGNGTCAACFGDGVGFTPVFTAPDEVDGYFEVAEAEADGFQGLESDAVDGYFEVVEATVEGAKP